MQPVGALVHYRVSPASNRFYNGYFNAPDQSAFNNTSDKFITTFAPGQAYYYSVVVNYTNYGIATMQPSTVLKLVAGTNGLPAPSNYGLKFPGWIPAETTTDPWLGYPNSPTNQLRVTGETFSLTNSYSAYTDYGLPVFQWRKDGVLIGSPQSFIPDVNSPQATANGTIILTITNAQPSDAGVYDVDVRGNLWFIGEKIYVSIQTTNGQGVFQDPKFINQNFVCDLVGAAGRNYKVQQSTNLVNWSDLVTLSNLAGTVTFTNLLSSTGERFYRTVLLP